ncbi:facilitated trehalose transporter Tret1-like [Plodia interpunctella]|uniref:facilitated trehalose transporter Tret1-like n=1 Tax=Plodia interpunctella TaxID=58824 RepID=UPI002368A2A7|nr:facilitated trehalose transporter Tret1-like [Plodia interpunctella]
MLKESETKMKKGHTYVQWMLAIAVESIVFAYGLLVGWVSPMKSVLQSETSPFGRPVTDMEMGWVASVVPLAAISGIPMFVYIADNYGRKLGIFVMAMFQTGCWILKLSTANVPCLILARVLAGIASGCTYQLIPVYVKETSQDSIRGMLVSMNTLMQNFGLLLMYAMGPYLDYYAILWIGLGVSCVTLVALIRAPETPPFMVKKGEYKKAQKTLAFLRGLDIDDKVVQNEIDCMKEDDRRARELPDVTLISIVKSKYSRTGLGILMLILGTQATNGTYVIFTYASFIISSSGVKMSPELQTLSIPIVLIVGSLVSISCIEKFRRKFILATGFGLTSVGLASLASMLTVQYHGGSLPEWMPIAAIILTCWCYSAAIVPLTYTIMAEMFNFQIRAKVSGCVCSWSWFMAFLQLLFFIPLSDLVGFHNTIFCFAVINLFGFIITLVLVPETKGKSLEEIEKTLATK